MEEKKSVETKRVGLDLILPIHEKLEEYCEITGIKKTNFCRDAVIEKMASLGILPKKVKSE
jgi:hypothetical protein